MLNVEIPKLHLEAGAAQEELPYSFADVTSEADHAVRAAGEVVSRLLRLAEMEKACAMLSGEIERSKRRVNALEYVMIPDLEETIRYISQKLEENERGNITRLMKVKDMLLKEAIEDRRAENSRAARAFGSSGKAPQEV